MICSTDGDEGKFVVVTDAEIFGRYKVQRARRLKSPHAQTSRSLLDIDFTELEEGDYVVHDRDVVEIHVEGRSRREGHPTATGRSAKMWAPCFAYC